MPLRSHRSHRYHIHWFGEKDQRHITTETKTSRTIIWKWWNLDTYNSSQRGVVPQWLERDLPPRNTCNQRRGWPKEWPKGDTREVQVSWWWCEVMVTQMGNKYAWDSFFDFSNFFQENCVFPNLEKRKIWASHERFLSRRVYVTPFESHYESLHEDVTIFIWIFLNWRSIFV